MERDTLAESVVWIRCGQRCGFVVNDRYFETKPQFSPGLCARCGAPVELVKPYTQEVDGRFFMDRTGRVKPVEEMVR